jgi:hypothetical protein
MSAAGHGLVCPACGAGLGDAQPNGDRVCAYCGQHVAPDPTRRAGQGAGIDFNAVFAQMDARELRENLAEATAQQQRVQQQNVIREDYRRVMKGEVAAANRAATRSDVIVSYVLMALFITIGLGFGGCGVVALASDDVPVTRGHHASFTAGPILVFAAFWFGMALMFLVIARRAQKRADD